MPESCLPSDHLHRPTSGSLAGPNFKTCAQALCGTHNRRPLHHLNRERLPVPAARLTFAAQSYLPGSFDPSPPAPPLTAETPRSLMRTEFVPAPYPIPATLACATKLAKRFPLRAPHSRLRLEAPPLSQLRQTRVGFPWPPLPRARGLLDARRRPRRPAADSGVWGRACPGLWTSRSESPGVAPDRGGGVEDGGSL